MWNHIHWRKQNRHNVIRFQDGFGESSLFSIQIGQFYIYNSHSLFHIAGSFWEQKEPTGMNISYIIHYIIYMLYHVYMILVCMEISAMMFNSLYNLLMFKREGRQIVTFSKLGSSVLFKHNSS